jgi:hypothetical protein
MRLDVKPVCAFDLPGKQVFFVESGLRLFYNPLSGVSGFVVLYQTRRQDQRSPVARSYRGCPAPTVAPRCQPRPGVSAGEQHSGLFTGLGVLPCGPGLHHVAEPQALAIKLEALLGVLLLSLDTVKFSPQFRARAPAFSDWLGQSVHLY